MFSETSENQLYNGVSHLILWRFWNFDFFFNPPHKLAKIYKNENILYNLRIPAFQWCITLDSMILKFLIFFPLPLHFINWQKITKMKTHCITCFQKPQNNSFPMVYHTWENTRSLSGPRTEKCQRYINIKLSNSLHRWAPSCPSMRGRPSCHRLDLTIFWKSRQKIFIFVQIFENVGNGDLVV